MTILLILNDTDFKKDDALKVLQDYTEREDLIIKYSFDKAKEFISNRIISKEQNHIDCIISDWKVDNEKAESLNQWLKNSDETYSKKNFKISSIPYILIEDRVEQSTFISSNFSSTISGFPTNTRSIHNSILVSIKSWRSNLSNDLELIGLDPITQEIYPQHRAQFISYYKLSVLSRSFVDDKSKNLNYNWFNQDSPKINIANEIFYSKMKLMDRKPVRLMEKEFHDFFLTHPTFLKGDNFIRSVYEPHLYLEKSRRYNEPDFINIPFDYSLRNPEIVEVKRHTQRFLWKNKKQLLAKARKSFEQVKRYKDYFNSKNNSNLYQIKKYLNSLFNDYEFGLLMGSYEEKEENEDLLNELKMEFDFGDINLITYDELLNKHIRLCNRLNNFYKA